MKIAATNRNRECTRSGAYMGGIGSGGFEPRPDGRFYRCQIWNEWRSEQELDAVFVHQDGRGNKRMLRLDDFNYTHGSVEGVSRIDYAGEFPRVAMSFPVEGVRIEYTSIFIPGDVANSSLPAVLVRVKGRGRLAFLMASRREGKPRLDKRVASVEGKWGAVGVRSEKGRPIAITSLMRGWAITFMDRWHAKDPFPLKDNRTGNYDIGVYWDKDFDDEFILAWHCPDMRERYGRFLGHYYSRKLHSLGAVMRHVAGNRASLKRRTMAFHRRVHTARVPSFVKDSYTAQLASMAKQSWLGKKGQFGVWEGSCDCCGIQTTDVAYYGSWLYSAMFPKLERAGIELTARHQRRADGWIPHSFYGSFKLVDEYRRKDMNSQFTLMVLRDYLQWRDRGFLRSIYPKVKKAVVGAKAWDTDGDGLPEVEGTAQTFDQWGFTGTSSYVGVLWLATLRAAARLARDAGDSAFANECEAAFPRAQANLIRKLWTGKWFAIASDGKKRDDCLLLDAISGDWFMRALGMGGVLPDALVRSHLRWAIRLNRKRFDFSYMKQYGTPGERGWCYINGGYTKEKRIGFQQYEPWTGIELTFAAHLLLMGMKAEGLRVIRDVHDRRVSCGTVWNHQECGGDYYRPFIIGLAWDLLTGALPPKA